MENTEECSRKPNRDFPENLTQRKLEWPSGKVEQFYLVMRWKIAN